MTTRIERIKASLKKEEERLEKKRLKKAVDYFEAGLAYLADEFSNESIQGALEEIYTGLDKPLADLKAYLGA